MGLIWDGLAAIFDGDKGAVLSAVLIVLLIIGVILLILNLTVKPAPPAPPQWEAVPDDTPSIGSTAHEKPAPKQAARRKA